MQPMASELVTLSMLPASQWQSLLHLDAIKVRAPQECMMYAWHGTPAIAPAACSDLTALAYRPEHGSLEGCPCSSSEGYPYAILLSDTVSRSWRTGAHVAATSVKFQHLLNACARGC